MSVHLLPKYQLIVAFCLALCISLLCTAIEARKRDGSDENSSEENKFVCPYYHGNYADPEDCESYYECNHNVAMHRKCPEWTKFDKYRRCCEPHHQAVCEEGSEKNRTAEEEKFDCPNHYGNFADPEDCESYYECNHKVAKHRKCPEWMKYDKYRRCCQPHYMAVCEEGSEKNKTAEEEQFNCPNYYGNFADAENCESYYECNHNVAKHRTCPEGTKFDKYRRCCQPEDFAVCEGEKDIFECPTYYGFYPDPEDCDSYFECDYGKPFHRKCGPWQKFDKYSRCCKPHHMAVCEEATTISTTVKEENTTESTTEKKEETTESTTVKEEETTESTTVKEEETTESTTVKEEETTESTTVEKEEVTEYTTVKKEEATESTIVEKEETTTEKEKEFVCENLSGFYPHPKDCSKFYKCTYFISSLRSCSEDQLFDEVKKECKPASEVDCKSRKRPITLTTRKPVGPPKTSCKEDDLNCIITETGHFPDWFECPDYIGSYPHPSSKRLFIFCINQKPFVKRCAEGMSFSEASSTCVEA